MKICSHCRTGFTIDARDRAFYQKMTVPEPTLCPNCRQQRRLSFRNERNLYHRKCDLTGKQIISIFSPEKPFPVYNVPDWWSDKWDPLAYGREFDFNRPFFEQWYELVLKVPRPAIYLQQENINCDYCNYLTANKDCYLIFAAGWNENCYYGNYLHRSRQVVDCLFVFRCENCYECVDVYDSYNLFYSQFSYNCQDSYFLYNCRNCQNCFGCVNLVNKKYYIFNQPYVKDEYQKKLAEVLGNQHFLEIAKQKISKLQNELPQKYYAGMNNESFTGDHISNCKNTYNSYDVTELQDCRYCTWFHQSQDCYDCYAWGQKGVRGYENHLCGNNFFNVKFSEACWNNVSNLDYCQICMNNTKDCFGCVGLRQKQYCILNKQYSQQDYESLRQKIIEHMKKTGEYGEFFPAKFSPFAYNETVAQEYFPLTKEEVQKRGLKWRDDENPHSYKGPPYPVAEKIEDVSDDILNRVLLCEASGKPYKLIAQELAFYRKNKLPIPRLCFDERYKARLKLRNPRQLFSRTCSKCQTPIQTTYSPKRPEIVYCEQCYLKEVY